MPIRFRCEHCRQRLTVSERKAGTQAHCPKCQNEITIPDAVGEADPAVVGPPSQDPTDFGSIGDGADGDDKEVFTLFEDEWVFDDGEPVGQFDASKVAISRNVLFMQGVLIVAVGVVALILGIMIGQLTAPQTSDAGPNPCSINGVITLARAGRDPFPDIGCVVLALPVEQRPNRNNKISIDSIRPGRTKPSRNDPSVAAILRLGGNYAVADANGRYQLQLPDRGKYFLLFVSGNADRAAGDDLDKRDLMQMGNYFLYANDLLGDHQYDWRQKTIRRNEQLNYEFEKL
jgi:phage FluMu protein Com